MASASQARPSQQGPLVQVAAAANGLSLWLIGVGPDDRLPVFYAGDMVEGKLRASVKRRTTARAVSLKFVAEARVYFSKNAPSGETSRSYGQTVALCPPLNITLQGANTSHGTQPSSFFLEPGTAYEWDVCFQLPSGPLPGALDFKYGSEYAKVCYTLSGCVDIPNWPDASVSYDLNVAPCPQPITPEMAQPIDMQPLLNVNSCCFSKGSALLTLALPRGAAVPFIDGARLDDQQLLPVVVGVDNSRSKQALGTVTVKLECVVHATAPRDFGLGGGLLSSVAGSNKPESKHWSFPIAEADIATKGVPAGATLPPHAVALPALMMRQPTVDRSWTRRKTQAMVQQPSVDVPNVLRLEYRLSLVIKNGGCGNELEAVVPLTFAPLLPRPHAPADPAAAARAAVRSPPRTRGGGGEEQPQFGLAYAPAV